PFIVMQYVEGESLASRLRRGPLAVQSVVQLGLELADALGAAHAAGVVHRDIKPQNIMLTPSGSARLLDCGLATRTQGGVVQGDQSPTISEGSGRAGTPSYRAPAQVQQLHVDGRANRVALGTVLYECHTGQAAFTGHSLLEVLTQVVEVDPPPP